VACTAALLAPLAACGDSDPEAVRIGDVPVLEGATRGPGTELGAGFTVAEGSVLLGTTFPSRTSYSDDGGFRALLLVTGPFREVFEAYKEQAADIGLTLAPDYGPSYCSPDRVYLCSGQGGRDPFAGRSAWVRAWRRPGKPDRPPVSHLYLQYRDLPQEFPPGTVLQPQPRADVGTPPETGAWPRLPEEGEPVEPRGDGQEPLLLPEGAQLVAHRGHGTCSPATGSTLVLRTEAPDEVIERILDQHPDRTPGAADEQREEDGAHVVHRTWGSGGGGYELWAVTRPDEPTYLLIDRCPVD
jgi:hypothetical protein